MFFTWHMLSIAPFFNFVINSRTQPKFLALAVNKVNFGAQPEDASIVIEYENVTVCNCACLQFASQYSQYHRRGTIKDRHPYGSSRPCEYCK